MKRTLLVSLSWMLLYLVLSTIAEAQGSAADISQDCAALIHLNLTDVQGGPAIVTFARIVDVPGGVRRTDSYPSGYSDGISHRSSEIRQYCDVSG